MTNTVERRARRAGLTVKKCRRGTVYADPLTGESIYDGNRSRKSPRHQRRIDRFLTVREKGGLS